MADTCKFQYNEAMEGWLTHMATNAEQQTKAIEEQTKIVKDELRMIYAVNDIRNHTLADLVMAIKEQTKEISELRTALENHSVASEANSQNLVQAVDNLSDFVWVAKTDKEEQNDKTVKSIDMLTKAVQNPDRVIRKD